MDLPRPSPYPARVQPVVIAASPEIAHPRAFLRRAAADLAAAPRLGWKLLRANLRAGRRNSLFGYLWLLIPALTATLVSSYLQQRHVVALGTTRLPYALHVLAGMVLWQTFLDGFNAPLQGLAGARQLVTRSALPHEAILVSAALEAGLNALVRIAVLALFIAAIGFAPAPRALALVPAGMAALGVLGFAIGLALAPLALLYDDVRRGLSVIMTFWFFVTPVLYAAPQAGLLLLNPVTALLEPARGSLLGEPIGAGFALALGGAVLFLVIAWLGYRVARPHVVERMG